MTPHKLIEKMDLMIGAWWNRTFPIIDLDKGTEKDRISLENWAASVKENLASLLQAVGEEIIGPDIYGTDIYTVIRNDLKQNQRSRLKEIIKSCSDTKK